MEKQKEQKRRKKTGKAARKRQRDLHLLAGIIIVAVLVTAVVLLTAKKYVDTHDDGTILSGISVGGTDVSGMTEAEAADAVEAAVSERGSAVIRFVTEDGNQFEATLAELGLYAADQTKQIQAAVEYGKSGNPVQARRIMKQSEKGKLEQDFPLTYKVSEETAEPVLQERAQTAMQTPENARVTLDEAGNVQHIEGQQGETLTVGETVRNLNRFLQDDWDGSGGEVHAETAKTDPEITSDQLSEVTDLLGSYTTYYGSDGSGRSQNVETGTSLINGTLLQSGEEMSADEAMRPYTEENGYAMAASYESDTVVESMGGGICQVSTTLYNALLYAELEIVERHPHSMLVSYVDASKDAAIADDVLDLVFRNNLDSPVYIEGVCSDGALTFRIYGKETRDPGRSLEFISEIIETTEPEGTRYVATEDAIGTMGVKSSAQSGVSAQLWKVVLQDGVEVSREVINTSQYLEVQETIGVGTASENASDTEKMNQAIQSQDQETIAAAIQEILYGGSDTAEGGSE
jgi:vancomycin resistance protein YoaR